MDIKEMCFLGLWGLIAISIMFLAYFVAMQEPMCSVEMGINADLNFQNEYIQNVSINGMNITAPCGSKLYNLYDNLQYGVN
jgi:hypothetical protein